MFPGHKSFTTSVGFLVNAALTLAPPNTTYLVGPLHGSSLTAISSTAVVQSTLRTNIRLITAYPYGDHMSAHTELVLDLPSPVAIPSKVTP